MRSIIRSRRGSLDATAAGGGGRKGRARHRHWRVRLSSVGSHGAAAGSGGHSGRSWHRRQRRRAGILRRRSGARSLWVLAEGRWRGRGRARGRWEHRCRRRRRGRGRQGRAPRVHSGKSQASPYFLNGMMVGLLFGWDFFSMLWNGTTTGICSDVESMGYL